MGGRCVGLGGVGEGRAGASQRGSEESLSSSIFRRRRGSLRIRSQPHLHCHLNKLPFWVRARSAPSSQNFGFVNPISL